MDRLCAACNEPCGSAHDCISCRKPVHSIVMCDSVWTPDEGRYFCGKECVVAHNQKKVEEFDAWADTVSLDELIGMGPDDLLPVRKRPDAPIEPIGPTFTVRRHSAFTEDDGTRGFTAGIADSTGRPGPTSPAGRDNDGAHRMDIALEPPRKKPTVKQTAAASRPKRKGKATEDPPVAAPAAASGLAAFGFGGASKPAGKAPPKRGASASTAKRTMKQTVQPGLATTEDGEVAQTSALWGIGAAYGSDSDEGGERGEKGDAEKRPKLSVRKMDKEDRKDYKAEQYRIRQLKAQDLLVVKFPWLACDPARGRHCSGCVLQPVGLRANDKLSTGYGNDGEGNPLPVPSEQKCAAHEEKKEHRLAIRNNQVCV